MSKHCANTYLLPIAMAPPPSPSVVLSVCLLLLLSCLCVPCYTAAGLPKIEHHRRRIGSSNKIKFLVVGDWGRKGDYNQTAVGRAMGRVGMDADFVVSTGDNFYEDGLKGEEDPAFHHSFTAIYTSLNKPWYAVLGNHDYRGDALAQFSPKLDPRWRCFRSFVLNAGGGGIGELFMVDTTPFVTQYFTHPKDHTYDWRGVLPVDSYISQLLKDLDEALKASNAKWKIVVGHHPIRSAGHHGDTQELLDQLLPILQANRIDLYINGHDHCLEHITDPESGIEYLTSGGGSKAWRGGYNLDEDNLKFYYDGQGFISVQLTQTCAEVKFYDVYGNVLYNLSVSKEDEEMLHSILMSS